MDQRLAFALFAVIVSTPLDAVADSLVDGPTVSPAIGEGRTPLVRVIDLNVGETGSLSLPDGSTATVKLLDLKETRDDLRGAVRSAEVDVEVNGTRVRLTSATYRRPRTIAGVQIDCSVT